MSPSHHQPIHSLHPQLSHQSSLILWSDTICTALPARGWHHTSSSYSRVAPIKDKSSLSRCVSHHRAALLHPSPCRPVQLPLQPPSNHSTLISSLCPPPQINQPVSKLQCLPLHLPPQHSPARHPFTWARHQSRSPSIHLSPVPLLSRWPCLD